MFYLQAAGKAVWLHGQAVKTSPFHGGNTGSIPVGVIFRADLAQFMTIDEETSQAQAEQADYKSAGQFRADVAQLAEQLICNQQVIGSSPIIGFFLFWTISSVG